MSESQRVVSKDGQWGQIIAGPEGDRRAVKVRFDNGQTALVPIDILERTADGSYHIAARLDQLARSADSASVGRTVIPAIEETVKVERRQVPGDTLRVHKRVHTHDEPIDEPILRDEVQIEHVPIGQFVTTAPQARREGGTLIIPVLEEVLVVEKRMLLKEEVHITRRRVEGRHTEQVRLRSEELEIERISPEDDPGRE